MLRRLSIWKKAGAGQRVEIGPSRSGSVTFTFCVHRLDRNDNILQFFFFCFFCCRLLQCGNDAPALVAVRGKSCAACDGVATAAMIFESAAESQ